MVSHSIASTMSGPGYLLRGLKLLNHRQIRPFAVVPIIINVLLFIWLTTLAVGGFESAMAWMGEWLTGWPGWIQWFFDLLTWLLWIAFVALLLIIYAYTFTLLSNLIGLPFYGLLAERVEEVLTGRVQDQPMTLARIWEITLSTIKREFAIIGYTLPRSLGLGILVLALLFTPLSFIGSALWFVWGAWTLALQYLDYAADNNGQSFPAMLDNCKRQRNTCLGFGAITMAATSVPVLNIVVAPAAVAGGTAMWVDKYR